MKFRPEEIAALVSADLRTLALEMAMKAHMRTSELKRELAEIGARKLSLEKQLRSASAAQSRLASFVPLAKREFRCPRCWIERETRSILVPVADPCVDYEFLRCEACQLELQPPQRNMPAT
jgi:hypothetical protein